MGGSGSGNSTAVAWTAQIRANSREAAWADQVIGNSRAAALKSQGSMAIVWQPFERLS